MTGLILRRLIQAPLILLVIYTITFLLAWALPGSAVLSDEGRQPPPEVLAAMEAQYNLDNPVAFYFGYLKGVVTALDFGPSFRYPDWTVNDIVASALPVSVALGLSAILIALMIGVAAGVVGAVRPNSFADIATLVIALIGISMPAFVIGSVLLIVFPVWLGIGSVGAWGTIPDMILPAITLSLPFAAYIARLTRMGMIESLGADYIRTARAKGVAERVVILRHALKNAFLPVLSFLGPAAAQAMTGSFVVEKVFNVPGLGQHFVNGVLNKDLFLIMGVVLIYASMLIAFNLIVDILYHWVDPRIEQA
ncbi:MAG: ABC transporter permease [Phycisphaerales bacterium]|nr:MAG: ABC transporter permease [Phycisphaerales bacterium]